MTDWQDISTAPLKGLALFFHPGNPHASLPIARVPAICVDGFHPDQQGDLSQRWREYPASPYTHWMPLPSPPSDLAAGIKD